MKTTNNKKSWTEKCVAWPHRASRAETLHCLCLCDVTWVARLTVSEAGEDVSAFVAEPRSRSLQRVGGVGASVCLPACLPERLCFVLAAERDPAVLAPLGPGAGWESRPPRLEITAAWLHRACL